jgi:hypothetical protein
MQRTLGDLQSHQAEQIKLDAYDAVDLCHLALEAHQPGEEVEDPDLPPLDEVPALSDEQRGVLGLDTNAIWNLPRTAMGCISCKS